MDINEKYIETLIQRCLDRTATSDERSMLIHVLKYIQDPEIEKKITEAFYKDKVIREPNERVWDAIKEKTFQKPLGQYRYRGTFRLLRYVAASILLLAIPLSICYRSGSLGDLLRTVQQHTTPKSDNVDKSRDGMLISEIQLVLADGKHIDLNRTDSTEVISYEGDIKVVHSADQIKYLHTANNVPSIERPEMYHTIKVPYGKRISVQLTDGSQIYMNSGTELRYPIHADQEQIDVFLKGEAYFEVAKSKDRKFNVHVPKLENKSGYIVQVLGTKFNVKAFEGDANSRTTLFEGSIQVSGLSSDPIILQPSMEIIVDKNFTVDTADVDMALAWIEHMFYFKTTPLEEVCLELERWYGVKVHYQTGENKRKLLGQISRDKSLSEVLEMLRQTHEIKYQWKGKEVFIME